MAREDLYGRITDQFSYRDDRADVWRAFDAVLDTDRFLNLGYSPRYFPHLLGSSQRRLVDHVGRVLVEHLPATAGVRLLDVGCGRGGPAVRLAERYGFEPVGVDLVPYNVGRARAHAAGTAAAFVVGDAARLPLRPGSVGAATAIDAVVYLPAKAAVFSELSGVLEPGGVLVLSDLVVRTEPTDDERAAVGAFAAAWDMPPLVTAAEYERLVAGAGFALLDVADVTAHSVGRFRRGTSLYRRLTVGPAGNLLDRLLRRRGLNPAAIDEQVRRAHDALPSLRHVVVAAEVAESGPPPGP